MQRLTQVIFVLSVACLTFGWSDRANTATVQEPPSRAPFSLDLPALKMSGITALEIRVPTLKLDTIRIRIAQPYSDQIEYNRIYTTLNAESANKIQTVKAAATGKIVELDLESRADLQLRAGKNVVEINATDSKRQQYYASFVIITGAADRGPVSPAMPAVSEEFTGRKYALVVGVSRYKFHEGGLSDLRYADADARSVAHFLKTRGGFRADDVSYLENEAATVEGVRAALDLFLTRARENDFVFLFIASHGAQDRFDPKNLYLILHDTKVTDMPRTALKMSELQNLFSNRLRARRMAVVIDACHSAAVGAPTTTSTRQLQRSDNNTFGLYAEKIFSDEGKALLTSSDVNEVSEEGPNWGDGHGVFTWALLEGLGGVADTNRDKVVTTGELFDFVSLKVRQETSGRQNPRALPGTNRNFPLARVQG